MLEFFENQHNSNFILRCS